MRFPAAKALSFLTAGILVAYYVTTPPEIPLLVFAGSLVVCGFSLYLDKARLLTISTAILLIATGFFRTQLLTDQKPSNHISKFTSLNQKVHINGKIAQDPDIRDTHTYLTIQTDSLRVNDTSLPVCGKALVRIKPATERFQYGDYVSIYGYLNKPPRPGNPNLFDYREYLGLKGVYAYVSISGDYSIQLISAAESANFISGTVIPVRRYLLKVFSELPTPGNGALLAGFLLGEKRGLLPEIREAFTATGTMHLLAVSGSNVALIAGIYFSLMIPLSISRRWKLLGSIPVLIMFSFLANNEPSVVRAVIIATLAILAFLWRRRAEPVNLACAAALIILAIYPLWLFDVGFQLSFAAVAGIILCYKSEFYKSERPRNILVRLKQFVFHSVIISLAAFVFTAPIIAYTFNRMAIYSVLANIPAAILILVITMMGVIAVVIYPMGGIIRYGILWATDQIISLMRSITEFFSSLPYSNPSISSPEFSTITTIYLALLVLLTFKWNKSFSKYPLMALLVFLNISVWADSPLFNEIRYNVEFLDAGYSDAMFVYSDAGENILIYSGDDRTFEQLGEKYLKPYVLSLGMSEINHLILTETGASSLKGLEELLGSGFIETVWIPSDSALPVALKAGRYTSELKEYFSGDELNLGSHIKHIALSPDINLKGNAKNNSSFPVLTKIFGTEILFLGKAELDSEEGLPRNLGVMQFSGNQSNWFESKPENPDLLLVRTGEPFRYWLEKEGAFDGKEPNLHWISQEGALRFQVGEDGIKPYRK